MGQLLNFTGSEAWPVYTLPTIFTPEIVERMARLNHTARALRALGYRVIDQDISPNDGGSPIIEIHLNGLNTRPVFHLASCSVRDTRSGYERVTIDGVRVFWARDTPKTQDKLLETL